MAQMFRRWVMAGIAAAAAGLPSFAQEVGSQLLETDPNFVPVQAPPTPQPRPPQTPRPTPVTPPRVTVPGEGPASSRTTVGGTGATGLNLAAAGTSARPVELPNMYGDQGGLYNFSPYTQAVTPGGQVVTLLPGQLQRFPAGTAFNRTVTGFSVLTTPTVIPLPNIPLPAGFREKLGARETITSTSLASGQQSSTDILVAGQNPQAHAGGLPVNTVRGAFKIGENESPRPVDRVYLAFNYFHDVNQSLRVPGLPATDVYRQTLGVEKTFLDGDASIGFRLPLLQVTGPDNLNRSTVGDLSVIAKFALINNPFEPTPDGSIRGGEVLSTGIVVTVPTGGAAAFSAQDPQIHPTVLQPFVGGIKTFRRSYAQFFTSVAVPTDSRDTTYWLNTLQAGYLLYRDPSGMRLVTSITPLIELDANVPLNNRGITRLPIGAYDVVSFTGGTTFGLGRRSFLNLGANVPVTGPVPYKIEGMVHLNILF